MKVLNKIAPGMFASQPDKREYSFYMELPNKAIISLIWCDMSYSDGGLTTCEMAAFKPDGTWLHPEDWDDDVKGYSTPADVIEFIGWCAAHSWELEP